MYEFKVGETFPLPEIKAEGAVFSIEPYTMMLTYRFNTPTPEEIHEFTEGDYELAVTELRNVIFFMSKFGDMAWSDAAYNPHLSDTEKKLPDLPENSLGYSLDCFLVDAATNKLAARRLLHLDARFYNKFRKLIQQSIGRKDSFDKEHFGETVQELYQQYSTKDLYKYSLMKTKGTK